MQYAAVISADVPCTYYVPVCSGEIEDEDEDGDGDLMYSGDLVYSGDLMYNYSGDLNIGNI